MLQRSFFVFLCLMAYQTYTQAQNSWLLTTNHDVFLQNLPADMQDKINTLRQRGRAYVQCAGFGPKAHAWLLSYFSGDLKSNTLSHNASYWNFPRACTDLLDTLQKEGNLLRRAWTDNQAWFLLYDRADLHQSGLPVELLNHYAQAYREEQSIVDIALLTGGVEAAWVLITDKNVYYENIPFDLVEQLKMLQSQNAKIQQLVFAPDASAYLLLYNDNQYLGKNLNPELEIQLTEVQKKGWKVLDVAFGY